MTRPGALGITDILSPECDATVAERFWSRIERGATVAACDIWLGASSPDSAVFRCFGGALPVRRIAFVLRFGAIPAGHMVKVTCGQRRCVKHLALLVVRHKPKRRST